MLYVPLSIRSDRSLQVFRQLTRLPIPVPADVEVDTRTFPTGDGRDIRVVTYEQADRSRPSGALLWMHGGGTVFGRPEQGHELCTSLALELDILVVSVDYRLAPEHPFPDGLDDCYATLEWLSENAASLGVDAQRIAVGGDSAGGGLAAALSQRARDAGGPDICFQLLEYPMLDDRTVLRADHAGRGAFIWTPASNRYAWTAYLGHPPDHDDERPYAAAARCSDLSGLPPAWIGVGDLDLFYEEDIAYAERLRGAGVPCDVHVEPGTYHGADSIMPNAPSSQSFRARMTAALRAGLRPPA
jgi:acetyl esterase/lipase